VRKPVTVLRMPRCSDEENYAIVDYLVRWASGNVGIMPPQLAPLLFRAADFLQVDELLSQCEDVMLAALEMEYLPHCSNQCPPMTSRPTYHSYLGTVHNTMMMDAAGGHGQDAGFMCSAPDMLEDLKQHEGHGGELGGEDPIPEKPMLAEILDLISSYPMCSGRLMHLCAQWLITNMAQVLLRQGAVAATVRHKSMLIPALVSELRDRLVALVMLNDDVAADSLME